MTQEFDADRLELRGDARPVAESVEPGFSASDNGILAYRVGSNYEEGLQLSIVDRSGKLVEAFGANANYQNPVLSADQQLVAFNRADQNNDLWITDLVRRTTTRLTFDAGLDNFPVWSPDGARIVFSSNREGGVFNLYEKTGTAERLTTSPNAQYPMSISPDGTRLIVREEAPTTGLDLRVLRLDPSTSLRAGPSTSPGSSPSPSPGTPPRQTEPLLATTFNEHYGELSPDGRWLAFQSNASGRDEIYVRPFPNVDAGNWMVSTSGGTRPLWARNGTELFYLDRAGAITRVPIQTTPTFSAGTATTLFETRYFSGGGAARSYDVSLDGQRFLMIKEAAGAQAPTMVVVLNWQEELKAKLPTQ